MSRKVSRADVASSNACLAARRIWTALLFERYTRKIAQQANFSLSQLFLRWDPSGLLPSILASCKRVFQKDSHSVQTRRLPRGPKGSQKRGQSAIVLVGAANFHRLPLAAGEITPWRVTWSLSSTANLLALAVSVFRPTRSLEGRPSHFRHRPGERREARQRVSIATVTSLLG